MNFIQDFRFNHVSFNSMIGDKFIKYKCDPFVFTNTVTGIIGLYIGNKVYELRNEQQYVDYYDTKEDMAIWNLKESKDSEIFSFFSDNKQIETPINEKIQKITLINEHQQADIKNIHYEVWITRAIVFHLETKDVYFEKDNTAFSEEIEIKRGYNLLSDFPKRNDYFLDSWQADINPIVETEFITIQ